MCVHLRICICFGTYCAEIAFDWLPILDEKEKEEQKQQHWLEERRLMEAKDKQRKEQERLQAEDG